jgi:hypothetical protein
LFSTSIHTTECRLSATDKLAQVESVEPNIGLPTVNSNFQQPIHLSPRWLTSEHGGCNRNWNRLSATDTLGVSALSIHYLDPKPEIAGIRYVYQPKVINVYLGTWKFISILGRA